MYAEYENSRRFYENRVVYMIKEQFPQYENRIAVGIAGEGSDCFGYDDFMSRDHDFGTGVCLWLTDDDMELFGKQLSDAYNELIDKQKGNNLTARLRARRGVMTVHDFYSNILGIECDTKNCVLSEDDWEELDHNCLATAVNGTVFVDPVGEFTAFRKLLLDYYPDKVWKMRIVNELHKFSAALQVNYARCMTRGDIVAARLCHMHGLESAMELYFLMKRVYPPYYKWTYRKMTEIDADGKYSSLIKELSVAECDVSAWEGKIYNGRYINMNDRIVLVAEQIAGLIVSMLRQHGLTEGYDPYLETYVDEMIADI